MSRARSEVAVRGVVAAPWAPGTGTTPLGDDGDRAVEVTASRSTRLRTDLRLGRWPAGAASEGSRPGGSRGS